jgi:hypothetical protein
MKQQETVLAKELTQFKYLIGTWTFEGYFKNDSSKIVEGWETYRASRTGSYISCQWRVDTIGDNGTDTNKGKMKIGFSKEEKKIVAHTTGTDYVLRLVNNILVIQNDSYRFTGKLIARKNKITGKWETKEKNKWKYWCDKYYSHSRISNLCL